MQRLGMHPSLQVPGGDPAGQGGGETKAGRGDIRTQGPSSGCQPQGPQSQAVDGGAIDHEPPQKADPGGVSDSQS